jgi:hypothetical protein
VDAPVDPDVARPASSDEEATVDPEADPLLEALAVAEVAVDAAVDVTAAVVVAVEGAADVVVALVGAAVALVVVAVELALVARRVADVEPVAVVGSVAVVLLSELAPGGARPFWHPAASSASASDVQRGSIESVYVNAWLAGAYHVAGGSPSFRVAPRETPPSRPPSSQARREERERSHMLAFPPPDLLARRGAPGGGGWSLRGVFENHAR